MKINFLDTASIKALKSHINMTTDICAYELGQIDWPDADNESRQLSRRETENLLHITAYLLDKQRKKELATVKPLNDNFKLASLFMGKNDLRIYLNEIYSDGTNLIASNGCILIKIVHRCAAGYYDAHGVKTGTDAKYPDFNRVLNDTTPRYDVDLSSSETFMYTPKTKGDRLEANGKTHAYPFSTIQILKKIGVKTAQINDAGNLYFEGDTFTGVIMPMRT